MVDVTPGDRLALYLLLLIAAAAFAAYRNGELSPWLRAKFINAADPAGPNDFLSAAVDDARDQVDGAGGFAGPTASGSIVTVAGIQVDKSIAREVDAMVKAAAADGVTLTGSGWRSSDRQQALYDAWKNGTYNVPAVAKPGTSMHEKGLAIDFNNAKSRSTEVYRWLAANAATCGFKNLPSEPWHWSTNGR